MGRCRKSFSLFLRRRQSNAPRRTDSFSQNKPRKISLKNKRLLDDYSFTSICFSKHWFPLQNKLCFLNFPVGAWYKTGPPGASPTHVPAIFSLLIFSSCSPFEEEHGFTSITLKNNALLAYFFASYFFGAYYQFHLLCRLFKKSEKLFLHVLIKQWYKFKNFNGKFLNLYHCLDGKVQEKFFTFFEETTK